MEYQVGRLRDIHYDSKLVHMVDMWEVNPMGCMLGMFLDKLRVQH